MNDQLFLILRLPLSLYADHYVCRIDDCPDPTIVAKSKRKRGQGKAKKKQKRFRGDEKDRTCPDCKRVFTSALGMKYHVRMSVQ